MLVLQIALGIVLAVVILVYWREILALGALLAVFGVILVVVGFGLWVGADALMTNKEHIGVWAAVVGFFGAVFGGLAGLHWLLEKRGRSAESQRKELGYGEDRPEK